MLRYKAGDQVLILGATSAMARATALAFAREGYGCILAGRDAAELGFLRDDLKTRCEVQCHTLPFDAEDAEMAAELPRQCQELAGGLPAGLVLFFGYMPDQAHAQEDAALARKTINVNLAAAIAVLETFAAAFEKRGSGFIGVVSSVAGDRGRQSNYIYGAAKAGLSTYAQGLRNRLAHSGISVTTLKPGFVDTAMTFGLPLPEKLVATPQQAGDAICKAVLRQRNIAYVPFFWRYIMWIIRAIPEWRFKKMKL